MLFDFYGVNSLAYRNPNSTKTPLGGGIWNIRVIGRHNSVSFIGSCVKFGGLTTKLGKLDISIWKLFTATALCITTRAGNIVMRDIVNSGYWGARLKKPY